MRPLITVFNGRERGLGEDEKPSVYVKQYVEFRNHLKHFKGSSLNVFQCICLHANEEGWAWPSLATICRLTGRNRHTVQKAIAYLAKLEIPGYGRVMLKSQPRNGGRFLDTHYLIFPSKSELEVYEQGKEFPPRLQKRRKSKNSPQPSFSPTEKQAPKKQAPKKQAPKNRPRMHEPEPVPTRTSSEPDPHTQPEGVWQQAAEAPRAGVSVCDSQNGEKRSIHRLEVLLEYLEKQPGAGIKFSPLAVAQARFDDGKIDAVVSAWLAESKRPDVKDCPDCQGRGVVYLDLDDPSLGVKRCAHARLSEASDAKVFSNVA